MAFRAQRPERKRVHTGTAPVGRTLDALDLEELRCAYAALIERGAAEVQYLGYEQDDSVVEAFLLCAVGDQSVRVALRWLTDRERLAADVLASIDTSAAPGEVEVRELHLETWLERWP